MNPGLIAALHLLQLVTASAGGGWAIAPGHDQLFSTVTAPGPGELPEGWGRRTIAVPRDRVEITYGPTTTAAPKTCQDAPLCLTLTHPELAPPGALRTGPFALTIQSAPGAPSVQALLDGVTGRIA
ncbi:MAG: hypothetical protein QF464_17030, partial [Myxococcota bacterium]|nr:hypothetical protein [Myxococcota bacterium]